MLLLYHLFTLLFGMAIAALAGNAQQAALIVPIFLGIFASFSGVLVPYAQITAFWRYWLYYINPWSYALGGQESSALHIRCNSIHSDWNADSSRPFLSSSAGLLRVARHPRRLLGARVRFVPSSFWTDLWR